MKTKLLLLILSFLIPLAGFNQATLFLNDNESPVPFERNSQVISAPDANISEWYNFGRTIFDMGGNVSYFRNYLFPDSTVQVEFSQGMGYIWKHSLGQVLDPASGYFTFYNTVLDSTVSYTLDSIGFYYRYLRFQDSVPDTIVVQIYENNKITFAPNPWNDDRSYARVPYNYITRKGTSPSFEYVRLLSNSDTAIENQKFLTFPVNITVPAGKKVAATITYFPGHPFNINDTIDVYLSPPPVNPLNAFIVYDFRDNDKNKDSGIYNNGLLAYKTVRYNVDTSGWNNKYIPGTAWSNGFYHLDMAFKISTINLGDEKVSIRDNSFFIFPNYVKSGDKINIHLEEEGHPEFFLLDIFDLTGRKVFSGKTDFNKAGQNIFLQIPSLEAGMYIVNVQSKEKEFSSKLFVYQK